MSLSELLSYYDDNQNSVIARSEATKQSTLINELLNTKLGYSEQYGSLTARASISKLYSNIQASNILLTSGASEAIFLVMSTMFKTGDSIIVQQPIYQSLYQVAADHGVSIIDWNLNTRHCEPPQAAWQSHWSISELAELIKANPQAKALVINNPNNPTGLGFKREELKQIAALLDGRYLISDEVFLFISQSQLPSALDVYDNSIVISDLSKSFNMPGLRLGWIAINPSLRGQVEAQRRPGRSNPELLESFSSLKNYLSLRTNTLSETIAPWVLEKHQEITAKNRSLLQANIEHLYSLHPDQLIFDLSQIPKEAIEGLCIFPKLKPEHRDFDFQKLLNEQGVFVATGGCFGESWGKYLRIGIHQIKKASVVLALL